MILRTYVAAYLAAMDAEIVADFVGRRVRIWPDFMVCFTSRCDWVWSDHSVKSRAYVYYFNVL